MGLWDSDYAHAYAYPSEDEEFHDDYSENGEKTPDPRQEGDLFNQKVVLNKTKPQPCDQEVNYYKLDLFLTLNLSSSKFGY